MRSIDVEKGLLRVITPVPVCSLEKVDIILQGCIEVPACLLQVVLLHFLRNILAYTQTVWFADESVFCWLQGGLQNLR